MKRGDPLGFINILSVANIKKSEGGTVTARSRSGLWLQTTEDRERSRRQSEIPQILLQLVTLKPYP